ncbi:MAG: hypothetical protein M1830_006420, partial [Pleopsidium flavum]
MDGNSPISPEHPNSRAAPGAWVTSCNEYFPTNVPTSNPSSNAFTYGNWEEWMRWDGAAEALSPKQLHTSPPTYRRNKNVPPLLRHETSISPGIMDGETVFPESGTSVNPLSTSAMDISPFTFAYNNGNQTDFQFSDAINPVQDQPSPREYNFRPDIVDWNASPLQPASDHYRQMSPLTVEEHQHLRNVAFQRTSSYGSHQSYGSTGDVDQGVSASPEPTRSSSISKKRKSSGGDEVPKVTPDSGNTEQPPVKKTAHNMIEKRYRTNLNDKIAALRDSVPSLRAMPKNTQGNAIDGDDDREDLDGLTPAHKLNKATVLSKATEYIHHLERRNKRLEDESSSLRTRIRAFEKLAIAGSIGTSSNAGGTTIAPRIRGPPFLEGGNDSQIGTPAGPQGLIQVPENIKKLRAPPFQPHYAHQAGYHDYQHAPSQATEFPQDGNGRGRGRFMSKLMVGSLAGLMVLEGFTEREQNDDKPAGRGLFALPLELLNTVRSMINLPQVLLLGSTPHLTSHRLLPLLKLGAVVGVLILIIYFYLCTSKPKNSSTTRLSAAPSLASPIEVRRKAWLTSIQNVWVPRHMVIAELAALGLKFSKYFARLLIGWPGYAWLTGRTEDDEIARIKAWDIAIDAQLAGGDAEISKSRLVLTIIAAGTLPSTPARLMLKALHLRVLLWEAARSERGLCYIVHVAATKLAKREWNIARELQRAMRPSNSRSKEDTDSLPEHLAKLLELDCDEVMGDSIVQRAYNLTWNRPTRENTEDVDVGMDIVVDDFAIRSPLDALAAWWSSLTLHRALLAALEKTTESGRRIQRDLDLALSTAPPTSSAHTRALAGRAIFLERERGENIAAVMQALPPSTPPQGADVTHGTAGSIFIDSTTPIPACNGIRIAVRCAMTLAMLKLARETSDATAAVKAVHLFNTLCLDPSNLSLLGVVAAHRLLEVFSSAMRLPDQAEEGLGTVARVLRLWIGAPAAVENGLSYAARGRIKEECAVMCERRHVRRESVETADTGYASFSDGEREEALPKSSRELIISAETE